MYYFVFQNDIIVVDFVFSIREGTLTMSNRCINVNVNEIFFVFFSIINLLRLFQTPEIHLKIYLTPLNSLTLINGLELTPLQSLMPMIIFLTLSDLKKKLKNHR
jgi:hypothetical protein